MIAPLFTLFLSVELGFEAFVIIQLCIYLSMFPYYPLCGIIHSFPHPGDAYIRLLILETSFQSLLFFFSIYASRLILFFAASEHFFCLWSHFERWIPHDIPAPACTLGFPYLCSGWWFDHLCRFFPSFVPRTLTLAHWFIIAGHLHWPKFCDGTNRTSNFKHITFAQSSQLDEDNRFQAGHWNFQLQPSLAQTTEVCSRFRIQFLVRMMNLALIWNTVSDLLLEKVAEDQRWVRRDPRCIIKWISFGSECFLMINGNGCSLYMGFRLHRSRQRTYAHMPAGCPNRLTLVRRCGNLAISLASQDLWWLSPSCNLSVSMPRSSSQCHSPILPVFYSLLHEKPLNSSIVIHSTNTCCFTHSILFGCSLAQMI